MIVIVVMSLLMRFAASPDRQQRQVDAAPASSRCRWHMNDSPGGLLQLIAFNNLSDEGRAIFLPATGRNFSDVERFAVLQTRTSLH
ncbi:unnamed protein product, partial [Symbiodinium sp. CCMP2592]